MNYESPTLEMMGQMEELTGSCGIQLFGDAGGRCAATESWSNPDGTVVVTQCVMILSEPCP